MADEQEPGSAPFCQFTEDDWKIPKDVPPVALSKVLPKPMGKRSSEFGLLFDLWKAALREAGHVVVGKYFGMEPQAYLLPTFRTNDQYARAVTGRSHYRDSTPLNVSCFSWAGPIMSYIHLPDGCFESDADEILVLIEDDGEFSESDIAGMSLYTKGDRAFRTAYKILHDDRLKVMEVARHLVSKFWDLVKSIPPAVSPEPAGYVPSVPYLAGKAV